MNPWTRTVGAAVVAFSLGACSRDSGIPRVGASSSSAAPLSYEAQQGKLLYQHYCLTCHGEAGVGDGFNAFNLDPRPQDLSDASFQKKKTDADFADAIRRGGAGVGLSPLMPPWGHTLSEQEIDELVRYLRVLRK